MKNDLRKVRHPLHAHVKRWIAATQLNDCSTEDLLQEAKRRLNISSDYALSKALNVTPTTISRYKTNTRAPSALVCIALASVLGLDAAQVLELAEKDRNRNHASKAHPNKTRSLFTE